MWLGINRDLQSLTPAEESEGAESDSGDAGHMHTLPPGATSGKFFRQMSEQISSKPSGSRKTRTYPPKDASAGSPGAANAVSTGNTGNNGNAGSAESKPKPPQRSKVQVAALEVHNVKKAISRWINTWSAFIRLETKSYRILPLIYVVKYDRT